MRRLLGVSLLSIILNSAAARADGPALQFSSPDMDTTPKGNVQFHGPFNRDILYVTADQLPAHEYVEISFDLLILRTWDGSLPITTEDEKPQAAGPDYVRVGLYKGPTLMYSTFSNMPDAPGFRDDSKTQQYPSPLPGDTFPPQTGSAVKNQFGYGFPNLGPEQFYPMDALYHIHYIIPHKDAKAVLEIAGINLQDIHDESWGVTEVKITPLAADAVKKPSAEALAAAFKACQDSSNADLPGNFQTLINGGDDTVAYLDKNVKPSPVDGLSVENLVKDLLSADDKIEAREGAHQALLALGANIEPALRDARKTAVGEQRLRIDWVLAALDLRHVDDDQRAATLAQRVLEIIGTPKALALRRRLAML